jgi:hypothetical protein
MANISFIIDGEMVHGARLIAEYFNDCCIWCVAVFISIQAYFVIATFLKFLK